MNVASRSVLLSVGSSMVANQIIRRRMLLKDLTQYRGVYIAPDRSVTESAIVYDSCCLVETRKGIEDQARRDREVTEGRTVIA